LAKVNFTTGRLSEHKCPIGKISVFSLGLFGHVLLAKVTSLVMLALLAISEIAQNVAHCYWMLVLSKCFRFVRLESVSSSEVAAARQSDCKLVGCLEKPPFAGVLLF
jgi:hypothetical protein